MDTRQIISEKKEARKIKAQNAKIIVTVWYPAPSKKETYYDAENFEVEKGFLFLRRTNGETLIVHGVPFKVVEK